MLLDVGDLLRATVKQKYTVDNTAIYNVMTYKCVYVTPSFDLRVLSQDILLTFFSGYWDTVRGCQSTTLEYESVLFENLNNWDVEFKNYIPSVTLTGGIASASMPTFNAFSIELLRVTRSTRNGSKRIGCIPEAWITGNILTNAGGITAVDLATVALGQGWDFEDAFGVPLASFDPVITNKPVGHAPPTIVNPVNGAQYKGLGTQGTRKLGRGI